MNLCSRNSPYSLNCHVVAMLVFCMLCRITQSSDMHRTESVSVMDHEQTMGVSFRVLDQKQLLECLKMCHMHRNRKQVCTSIIIGNVDFHVYSFNSMM